MKFVKVQYTVKSDFSLQNKANIKALMDDLRQLGRTDLKYTSYMLKDAKTFVHISQYDSDEAQEVLLTLPAFRYFQSMRDENIEIPQALEEMTLVSSSFDIFNIRQDGLTF